MATEELEECDSCSSSLEPELEMFGVKNRNEVFKQFHELEPRPTFGFKNHL